MDFVDEQHVAFFEVVNNPARSPAFSMIGPLVALTFVPIALARM